MELIIFVAMLCTTVHAYDWGGDAAACTRMMPANSESMKVSDNKDVYRLEANTMTFSSGMKVLVRVMGKNVNDDSKYSGLFLVVKEADVIGKVAGTWDEMHPNKYRRLSCNGSASVAIAESITTKLLMPMKKVEEDVFVWNAPDCMPGAEYDISATVIQKEEIFTGISITLKCVLEAQQATKPKNACAVNFHAGLMETSFETGFDGWWNDPMSSMRWTRHKGSTPSPGTGPRMAYDGEYYLYTEVSYPAKEGDIAILNMPPGLTGCYCMRLRCHSWMGKGTYFQVIVNGKVMWTHDFSMNGWLEGWQSVNDPDGPQLQLLVHRGIDFRGDIAIDTLRIDPGLCPMDLDKNAPIQLPIWENIKL